MALSPSRRVWGSRNQTSATTAQEVMSERRWRVKLCCRLFQNASTKVLLYLMATGLTVAPRSKAPLLNMTQYSLFTHVPSGKISRGLTSSFCTCALILAVTAARSLASVRLNQTQPRELITVSWKNPTHPLCFCMITAKGMYADRMIQSIMEEWLHTHTRLACGAGRGPWNLITPVHEATKMEHMSLTIVRSTCSRRLSGLTA
mmetsp:Transcript_27613/g.77184  ORF Transcript_27613/g.77184 Transcript_27613/m.77184 type:complete len:203 (+) Transcript_27613:188-796(+)